MEFDGFSSSTERSFPRIPFSWFLSFHFLRRRNSPVSINFDELFSINQELWRIRQKDSTLKWRRRKESTLSQQPTGADNKNITFSWGSLIQESLKEGENIPVSTCLFHATRLCYRKAMSRLSFHCWIFLYPHLQRVSDINKSKGGEKKE